MLHADEVRKGQNQIQFALAVLEGARLQPLAENSKQVSTATARALRPYEINVSGPQVLAGVMSGIVAIGLLVWAVVRLWLFGG